MRFQTQIFYWVIFPLVTVLSGFLAETLFCPNDKAHLGKVKSCGKHFGGHKLHM